MDPRPSVPVRQRRVWFSPYLLAVALTPALMQQPISCAKTGDTTLSELAIIVDGQDQLQGFDPHVRTYSISLPGGTDEALVHALPTDPDAKIWVDVVFGGVLTRYLEGGLGGGDIVVPLQSGLNTITIWVKAPGGKTDFYSVGVGVGQVFPCTEQGILDAIAAGGGPHTVRLRRTDDRCDRG